MYSHILHAFKGISVSHKLNKRIITNLHHSHLGYKVSLKRQDHLAQKIKQKVQ